MKDVIIKTTDARVLYYYTKDGICVKNLKNSNDNPKLIFSEGISDFDVIEKENGEVSIICQDAQGGIIYLSENGKTYLKSTLLKSKKQIPYDKFFRLQIFKNEVAAFYIIEHQERKILSFQLVEKENSLPYAVDEISGIYYFAYVDHSGVLYVFYEKENRTGYKYCVEGQWSSFETIAEGKLKSAAFTNEYIFLAVGKNENSMLMRLGMYNKKCDIIETGFFDENSELSLVYEMGRIWVVKQHGGRISAIKSDENFNGFGKEFIFGAESNLKKIRFKSCRDNDCPDECFVSFNSIGPKAVIYKNIFTRDNNAKPPAGNMIKKHGEDNSVRLQIELNKLKIEIEELKKEILRLYKRNSD